MRLSQATRGQVVRNVGNGSHYRFERPERGRSKIVPLELFPNGRLIAKPTPTIVSPDLEVVLVGDWAEGMRVGGKPDHTRATYERQLEEKRALLVTLEAAYELLPRNGTGEESRGSWSNKLINCRRRIEVLALGLEDVDGEADAPVVAEAQRPAFRRLDLIQLPSGLPGRIERMRGGSAEVLTMFRGERVQAPIPVEALRPWSEARLATV